MKACYKYDDSVLNLRIFFCRKESTCRILTQKLNLYERKLCIHKVVRDTLFNRFNALYPINN